MFWFFNDLWKNWFLQAFFSFLLWSVKKYFGLGSNRKIWYCKFNILTRSKLEGQTIKPLNVLKFLHFRKSSEEGFVKVFKIWTNKKIDKQMTTKITIQGTCCWVIEGSPWIIKHSSDEKQELRPGQSVTPRIAYIRKLKSKKCIWLEPPVHKLK